MHPDLFDNFVSTPLLTYHWSNILYIKCKYDVDITTTNIQQCIKCIYDTGQENAHILFNL